MIYSVLKVSDLSLQTLVFQYIEKEKVLTQKYRAYDPLCYSAECPPPTRSISHMRISTHISLRYKIVLSSRLLLHIENMKFFNAHLDRKP